MSDPRLIAFTSPAMGSGKSTAAAMLQGYHGFTVIRFAGPVKCMTRELLRCAGVNLTVAHRMTDGDLKEKVVDELGVTPRKLMQELGTAWGRERIREDLWVHIAMTLARREMAAGKNVVIDDMRFRNEYDAVVATGGECFRIVRPGATVTRQHASEGELDGIAMPEIWNTSDMDAFRSAVERAVFRA